MKSELKQYIYDNPNTWSRYIHKRPELATLLDNISADTIAEKAFIAVHGVTAHECKTCKTPTLFENFMKGYRPFCSSKCNQISKTADGDASLIGRIKALPNFQLLSDLKKGGKYGRKTFTVKNKNCGHEFEVNNLDLFTNPDNYCAVCGPKTRQRKLTNVNVFRKTEERKKIMRIQKLTFDQYSKLVRTLTRKTYSKFSDTINPNNLRISKFDHHIDHKVSIFDCWKNNVDARLVAAADNLQILTANENLQKSSKSLEDDLVNLTFASQWVAKIEQHLKHIDEVQITSTVISCESGKIGIALPQRNQDMAKLQCKFKHHFEKYLFFGELTDSAISKRLTYWDKQSLEKINARACDIVELKSYECRKFLDNNHSQGFLVAKVYLGLKIDGRLVSVMSFGKPRFSKKHQWELIRFASSTNVRGGASKLFKFFIKKFNPENVISYSNKSYGSGGVYPILGFKFTHDTPPTDWYYSPNDPSNVIKMSSFKYSTKSEFQDISEKYVNFSNKGNSVYVYSKYV